ncbi:MAG TPA: saccharopine dehydrogenase C-terminal domain-containing protein, partial [Candidatus Aminicenantes bacterium]|nr:saccharopine dehydrogenase C-terminal domain-containing protein [Candidatus Aminicenantes bacterium]
MKRVLVLGAGLVSRPGVVYLLNTPGIQVTVASRTVAKAEQLIAGHPNGRALPIDVEDAAALAKLVQEHDIAISLLPWIHHMKVADLCLKYGKHMVTASYVSDAMRALDPAVKAKGLIFLNEVGVDPGIDHMSAMKVIDEVHARGGKIVEFFSYCGGLPAPEANDNPFGYKFSWSPRGVVLASRNSCRFLEKGKIIEIPGQDLFLHYDVEEIEGLGRFEVYHNRDSVRYQQEYGIPEAITVQRGTYRNIGWCDTLKKIVDLGLIDESPRPQLTSGTFRQMMAGLLGVAENADVRAAAATKLNVPRDHFTLEAGQTLLMAD